MQTHENLQDEVKNTSETYKKYNIKNQAYLVFCGPLCSLSCTHFILNDCIWNFSNEIEAVVFAVQFFFTVRLPFPVLHRHIWQWFNETIYKLPKKIKSIAFKDLEAFREKLDKVTLPRRN